MSAASPSTDFVAAFARLLSDAECRRQFREDRHAVAQRLGIAECDSGPFLSLNADDLDRQAAGLIEKRQREVARRLPATWHRLGNTAAELFHTYANESWPRGHRRHLDDALSFCRWLTARGNPDVCRAEWNQLRFRVSKMPLSVRFVRRERPAGGRCRALQFLYRWRGRARCWYLYFRS